MLLNQSITINLIFKLAAMRQMCTITLMNQKGRFYVCKLSFLNYMFKPNRYCYYRFNFDSLHGYRGNHKKYEANQIRAKLSVQKQISDIFKRNFFAEIMKGNKLFHWWYLNRSFVFDVPTSNFFSVELIFKYRFFVNRCARYNSVSLLNVYQYFLRKNSGIIKLLIKINWIGSWTW